MSFPSFPSRPTLRRRALPALGEVDSVPARPVEVLGEDQASAWSTAILPLLECARVRLLLSGTPERADGRNILWLPYRKSTRARTRQIDVDVDAHGQAVIGYSRAEALCERVVLPVTFGALDGEASWRDRSGAGTRTAPAGQCPSDWDHPASPVHRASDRLC